MDAWSALLGELLSAAGVSQAWLAERVGVNEKTVGRWRGKEFPPKAENVRDVARVLEYPPIHALARVGFLTREEAGLEGDPVKAAPAIDPLLRQIQQHFGDPNIPQRVRDNLRRGVKAARDVWLDMARIKPPKEPAAPRTDRTAR
jgi:transcriptional regulator with XRE-family HTH domain